MRVKVLFFGMLKDITGQSAGDAEVPDGCTLGDILEQYTSRYPRLKEYDTSIVLARNQEFSSRSAAAAPGDEIAFMPPVSGGLGYTHEVAEDPAGHFFALTRSTIDTATIKSRLLRGADGAYIAFEGVARDNTKGRPTRQLEYECYEAMAVKMMASIGREIAGRHEIDRIAMVHRLGRLDIGETSVVVAVAAPHRKPAFAACLEGINRLKKLVPIWKKEFFVDGEVWVDGEWDESVLNR